METKNITPAEVDIRIRKGDKINMTFSVQLNEADYTSLADGSLKMIVKDFKGNSKRTFESTGTSPEISLSANTYSIVGDGFDFSGSYKYDLQFTASDSSVMTIQKGLVIIEDEQTT